MPSSYTPNYNLNQWEASDRVLRTDFNLDNAKIDAAIAAEAEARAAVDRRVDGLAGSKADRTELESVRQLALRSRFTKLWETTTTADGNVEIDLSGVDWTKWDKVHLEYEYDDSAEIHVRVNNIANTEPYIPIHTQKGACMPRVTFYPAFQPMRRGDVTYGFQQFCLSGRYDGIKKLVLMRVKTGTHITLWGEV